MWLKSILKWVPELVGLIRLVPAVRQYFEVDRRRVRASLISQLAHDVLSLVALQKGVSMEEAAQLAELIDLLAEKLVGEGLVSKARSKAIAASSAAGAVAKLRARADLEG